MAEYKSVVVWSREGAVFTDSRYSRGHRWIFDGGVEVPASASPHVIPPPMSVEAAVDPEEAFVASLSSCHMLWFLYIAAHRKYTIDSYRDEAVGLMERDEGGKSSMTRVTLRPDVVFSGEKQPAREDLMSMHDEAHEQCYIARSVKTEIRCEPV